MATTSGTGEPERRDPAAFAPVPAAADPAPPAPEVAEPEPEPAPTAEVAPTPISTLIEESPDPGETVATLRPADLTADDDPETTDLQDPAAEKRAPWVPPLVGWQAAAASGAAVGLAGVLLVLLVLRGCEAVRGTATCGGGPGFLALVAILVAMVLAGSAALRWTGVDDATSTSLLGVALLSVIAVLFLLGVIMSWAMIVVIPIVAAGTFTLSWWISTRFVELPD